MSARALGISDIDTVHRTRLTPGQAAVPYWATLWTAPGAEYRMGPGQDMTSPALNFRGSPKSRRQERVCLVGGKEESETRYRLACGSINDRRDSRSAARSPRGFLRGPRSLGRRRSAGQRSNNDLNQGLAEASSGTMGRRQWGPVWVDVGEMWSGVL